MNKAGLQGGVASRMTGASNPDSGFDDQPDVYDDRTGLPPEARDQVARAVIALGAPGPNDLVLEIGAGTGEIGLSLARMSGSYFGVDRSAPMLARFRTRPGGQAAWLARADCNGNWPVRDGSAAVVFASRVVHLLDADHVVRESLRASRRPGHLIIGRVVREQDSLKSMLRRRRRDLLQVAGYGGRDGEDGHRRVIASGIAAGGDHLGRQEVAAWTGSTTPATVIADWEAVTRMGSVVPDQMIRNEVLNALREWSRAEFGDPNRSVPYHERYVLDIIRLP